MFFHPPGVLVLFSLLQPLSSWWWPSARLAMLLIDAATAVGVWRLGMTLYGRREAFAAGLLYAASPLALMGSVRVGQDPIITALGVAGLVLLLTSPSVVAALFAGVCLGLALWFKYTAILFLPVFFLAAPRRSWATVSGCLGTIAVALIPYAPQLHALYDQTVVWQLLQRRPADPRNRLGAVLAYWLLLHPLALIALRRPRRPLWLVAGFALGGVFLFTSQVYYHYFIPIVPFAALLAAPAAVRLVRRRSVAVLAGLAVSVIWAIDVEFGSGPANLFVSADRFSTIQGTVRIIDRFTARYQPVLTDQLEYTYLANRPALADYFWNMRGVLNATALERRLPASGAVVMTQHVAPTYPSGLTDYLTDRQYREVRTGTTTIWLMTRHARIGRRVAAAPRAPPHPSLPFIVDSPGHELRD